MILYLPQLDLYCKTHTATLCSKGDTRFEIGHTKVLSDFGTVGRVDYKVSRYDFVMESAALIKERKVWKGDTMDFVDDFVLIFTDGFKLKGSVGEGIYLEPLGIFRSKRLPDHNSVFQDNLSTADIAGRVTFQQPWYSIHKCV